MELNSSKPRGAELRGGTHGAADVASPRLASPRLVIVACAFLIACGDGDWASSAQAVAPPDKQDPPPPNVGPLLHFGSPLPPPRVPQLGEITVEAVEGPVTKITSRLDNPELRTLIPLPDYSRFVGDGFFLASQLATEVAGGEVVPGGVSFDPGDLQMYGSGVSTTPVDSDGIPVFLHRGSVAASVIPWPEANLPVALDGGRGDTADLFARGVRLGYTPLTIQTRVTSPDGSLGAPVSTISLSLDPDVILVPIQVFAINSPSPTLRNYGGLGNVRGNLEVWDQVPSFIRIHNYSGGLLGQTSYSFGTWFGSSVGSWGTTTAPSWFPSPLQFAAYEPQGKLFPDEPPQAPDNSYYFTPDSIWRDCGVQFRLVRFETVELTDDDCDNLLHGTGCADQLNDNTPSPSYGGQDLHALCDQFESVVVDKALGGNLPDIPTLIVSYELANVKPGTGAGEVAITVDGFGLDGPVSCVGSRAESLARSMTLAHEVGHWAGGALSDDCGTEPSGSCQIDSVENQHAPPSAAECKTMRTWAIQHWSSFWLKPCPPDVCPPPPPVFRYQP
jgi:hypothetical protein